MKTETATQIENTTLLVSDTPERVTDKAILVNVFNTANGNNKSFWIPKSIMKTTEDGKLLQIPSWFIRQNFSWLA